MEIVQALKEFGITGMNAVMLAAIGYLARFILTRYDADITAKSSLAEALNSLSDNIKELRK
jgi:hypothetical protein